MQLQWRGAPGNIIARGDQVLYTIQSLAGGQHILQGIGNDDLPITSLGLFGVDLPSLQAAKDRAQMLEDQ